MSDLPIKKNVARTFYIPGLVSQADVKLFKSNPTIAAGDFKYSLDGGAWTNLATLPDVIPASGTQVRLQMAQAEMNGNQINVRWIDAAGAEWCDGSLMILTAAAQMAELSTLTAAQVDTQLSGTHGAGSWLSSGGTGAIDWHNQFIVTVSSLPRDGVFCRFTTDSAGLNTIASGTTNSFGKLDSLMLDAGTYYVWLQLAGVNFSNPSTEVVV